MFVQTKERVGGSLSDVITNKQSIRAIEQWVWWWCGKDDVDEDEVLLSISNEKIIII